MFVGETLALDLVNTEMIVRGKWRDRLETEQDMRDWWQAARVHYPESDNVHGDLPRDDALFSARLNVHGDLPRDDALFSARLEALKALRAALRHIFAALVESNTPIDVDLCVLNDVLRAGYHMLETTEEGGLRAIYRSHDRAHGQILLPIALSALHLIQDSNRHRLHKCDNERCILYFYDTTKSATRRWCSLGCMDRARSLQRYRRAKERNTTTE